MFKVIPWGQFKLHFKTLCDSHDLKRKPTSAKNPQASALLNWEHQTNMAMLSTVEVDMANTLKASDIAESLTNATWAI